MNCCKKYYIKYIVFDFTILMSGNYRGLSKSLKNKEVKMKRLKLGLVVLFVFFLVLILCSSQVIAGPLQVKWGATSVKSDAYATTVQFAGYVNKLYPDDVNFTIMETGGFIENLSRMGKGLLDIAATNPVFASFAYNGQHNFEGKANTNLRTIWNTSMRPQNIVAGKDSGITKLEDLDGAKMAFNPLSTSETLSQMFLEANGIYPKKINAGTSANLEAMKSRAVDAWIRAGLHTGAIMELAISRPLNFLAVTDEHIEKYNEKYPGHGVGIVAPAGQYSGQEEEFYSFAFVYGDVVDKDIPEDIVYKLVKTNWEKRFELTESNAGLRDGGFVEFVDLTLNATVVPFHPGTVKFLKELDIDIPDNLIPPELK